MDDCRHVFCEFCLSQYIKQNIQQGRIEQAILCPQCSKTTLSNKQLNRLVNESEFERILNMQLRQVDNLEATECLKFCQNCDYAEFISVKADKFQCMKCNIKICPSCNLEPHPNLSCKLYRESVISQQAESNNVDSAIEGVKPCPKCGFLIERQDGCNFMTCISSLCMRKTFFCYLCGIEQKYSAHFSHYKYKGPFGDTCNTIDQVNEDSDESDESDLDDIQF
ncbi:probable e3 ubiquitin-protein ligase ari8-like [Stylonychia lemnae]|uniref:Probable e3 ubiquitin-protein ligase ari8-like n=1 Tax=Stylonychia lemnae TaxID=5949 RepID=A0A078AXB8_STYLE|nr:probable e3 ubiquitin-protein ligase ari8-like [Stylonychia lemnae]|eukprot:CDW85423.1 probable e3 ubiquitin-protein ligase ari8-like [Stylonychia lemnae]